MDEYRDCERRYRAAQPLNDPFRWSVMDSEQPKRIVTFHVFKDNREWVVEVRHWDEPDDVVAESVEAMTEVMKQIDEGT